MPNTVSNMLEDLKGNF
ncbi:hypothetical protein KGM_201040 [Danaus plexippus plexippus]|uniref:Uncharacterized protein n=1 Tax=Danaus plexippus plexippus TaxID=278856 RepID=A0A212ELI1_DANPL|nr:hypothetical protein KGM_201040 [Danaus plexippus plexippus]